MSMEIDKEMEKYSMERSFVRDIIVPFLWAILSLLPLGLLLFSTQGHGQFRGPLPSNLPEVLAATDESAEGESRRSAYFQRAVINEDCNCPEKMWEELRQEITIIGNDERRRWLSFDEAEEYAGVVQIIKNGQFIGSAVNVLNRCQFVTTAHNFFDMHGNLKHMQGEISVRALIMNEQGVLQTRTFPVDLSSIRSETRSPQPEEAEKDLATLRIQDCLPRNVTPFEVPRPSNMFVTASERAKNSESINTGIPVRSVGYHLDKELSFGSLSQQISDCKVERKDGSYYERNNGVFQVDCSNKPGHSGGAILGRGGNNSRMLLGIVSGRGPNEIDGLPYNSSNNYTLGVSIVGNDSFLQKVWQLNDEIRNSSLGQSL